MRVYMFTLMPVIILASCSSKKDQDKSKAVEQTALELRIENEKGNWAQSCPFTTDQMGQPVSDFNISFSMKGIDYLLYGKKYCTGTSFIIPAYIDGEDSSDAMKCNDFKVVIRVDTNKHSFLHRTVLKEDLKQELSETLKKYGCIYSYIYRGYDHKNHSFEFLFRIAKPAMPFNIQDVNVSLQQDSSLALNRKDIDVPELDN